MKGDGPEADAQRNKKFKLIPRIVKGAPRCAELCFMLCCVVALHLGLRHTCSTVAPTPQEALQLTPAATAALLPLRRPQAPGL